MIPSRSDINVHDSLDERAAAEHFSGLDVDAAARLIAGNPLYYLEDLMWMGPKAFTYYVAAAHRFMIEGGGDGDPDAVGGLLAAMEFQLEHHASDIVPSLGTMRRLVVHLQATCR